MTRETDFRPSTINKGDKSMLEKMQELLSVMPKHGMGYDEMSKLLGYLGDVQYYSKKASQQRKMRDSAAAICCEKLADEQRTAAEKMLLNYELKFSVNELLF